jgi:hypothetical protein
MANLQTQIIPENKDIWNSGRQPAGCPNCGRVFLVQGSQIGMPCPLCHQALLSTQPARVRIAEPELMVPFGINQATLNTIYQNVVNSVWIKLENFQTETLLKRTIPVFWPMWLVDCEIDGHWQMETGFDYQVKSSKDFYANGQWQSRVQIEGRVRWEPRLGKIKSRVDNVTAPALEEHQNREQMTGTTPLNRSRAFDPSLLGGALIEVPDLPPEEAWKMAQPRVNEAAEQICTEAAGAQHSRNFSVTADYQNLNWTQFLLPMYVTYYEDDDGQPQFLVVNGMTGTVQGPRLGSREHGNRIAGIVAAVAGGLFVLALMGLLLTLVFPPVGVLAAILAVLGLGTGIGAIFPAVWPNQWNHKQTGPRLLERK